MFADEAEREEEQQIESSEPREGDYVAIVDETHRFETEANIHYFEAELRVMNIVPTWHRGPINRASKEYVYGFVVASFHHRMRTDSKVVFIVVLDRLGFIAMDVAGLKVRLSAGTVVRIFGREADTFQLWRKLAEKVFVDVDPRSMVPVRTVKTCVGTVVRSAPHPHYKFQYVWLVKLRDGDVNTITHSSDLVLWHSTKRRATEQRSAPLMLPSSKESVLHYAPRGYGAHHFEGGFMSDPTFVKRALNTWGALGGTYYVRYTRASDDGYDY